MTTINLTGSGEIGELEANWSVTEDATAHDISASQASTGAVSYTAQTLPDSPFGINDTATLVNADSGTVIGIVDTAGVDDLRASLVNGTMLTKLNADVPDSSIPMGGTYTLSQHFVRAIQTLLPAANISYTASTDPITTTPLWRGNVWDHLNQMAVAYKRTINVVGDVIEIRDLSTTVLNLNNLDVGSKPKVQISTLVTGRSVDVVYYNSQQVINGELYNAYDESNQMFQADFGESVTVNVVTKNYPVSLVQPTPTTVPRPFVMPAAGQYYVTAADNLPVPAALWTNYGGSVHVAPGKDTNTIDITVIGPTWRIPGYEGPFRLAVSSSGSDYSTLRINGTGTKTKPATLTILNGGDPMLVTQETATSVDNIFISTLAQAYDRGVWAADSAAGPTLTLTCSVPVTDLPGFGFTAGQLISYANNIFRITSVVFNNLNASITAVRYATAGDEATLWSGQTAGVYAAFWSGHPAEDAVVQPLRFSV
jgi:hypothetical protein